MDNDRHTPPRHKLVARSPVREGCISPDFFAFADIDCLRTASSYDKQNAPNTAERKLKRRNFTTSVCLPSLAPVNYNASAGQNCSLSPSTTTTVFTRGNLSPFPEKADSQSTKHGVARSVSLISSRKTIPPILVPSLSTLPQIQCQASPDMLEKTPRRHRDSRGSETTAVPDIGLTGDHLCDMEPPSLSPSKQFKANSPSQKTLSGTCMSSEEFINNAFAESMLAEHPLLGITFDHEMDVFQAVSKSRRPHSEGFPEHSQSVEADKQPALSGNGYSGCIAIPLSNQWAAMYARSSYAESGLVKSTFDLAKLLPSAPQ
ncbi:hypothetical protein IW140_002679 [Coemansia sp. RSA 1813]|nr:hypothetical protein EV178_000246 [Coemansia sp. RSA 1646]KAJ1767341.1 hypothetical protein LPJ74_005415 [Coemansia sp. RSA 1843]KAJ2090447.1 hypothetical protein IW138_002658 [Coemansia sp. RSA 986]KAJ2215414.1 hypothetical protein EV179_002198 [Coemansia sp. RSA 487]KAJ2570003.1 hypothetical protein IW140_002679 [Coemansia sp. RSA 1813]